ncbi:MAG: hypothetical protein AAF830_02440 [Pseudomonadota bacterium]
MRALMIFAALGMAVLGCAGGGGESHSAKTSGWSPASLGASPKKAASLGNQAGSRPTSRPVPAGQSPNYTGCAEGHGCFTDGVWVDAVRRFEPQSGRWWFLDPATGNTYFADNGQLRTGDPFQKALRQGKLSY